MYTNSLVNANFGSEKKTVLQNFVLTKLEVLNLTKLNITFSKNANFIVRAFEIGVNQIRINQVALSWKFGKNMAKAHKPLWILYTYHKT